jgi:hypothetical protein
MQKKIPAWDLDLLVMGRIKPGHARFFAQVIL